MTPEQRAELLRLAQQYAYDEETGHGESTGAAERLVKFVEKLARENGPHIGQRIPDWAAR